jgi:glycogen debranching enzyme
MPAPHTPRGCPFQAWSVGEALRLDQVVLKERNQATAIARMFRGIVSSGHRA